MHYTKDDIMQAIAAIRDKHAEFASPQKIHYVGHSFGSGIVSWVIKYFEPKIDIGNVTLLDAMPFCLHLSGLPRNFMYDPFEDGRYIEQGAPFSIYVDAKIALAVVDIVAGRSERAEESRDSHLVWK